VSRVRKVWSSNPLTAKKRCKRFATTSTLTQLPWCYEMEKPRLLTRNRVVRRVLNSLIGEKLQNGKSILHDVPCYDS